MSQDNTPTPTPPQIHSPGPPGFVRESSPAALSDDRSNSPSTGDSIDDRRKRKVSFGAICQESGRSPKNIRNI